MRKSLICEHRKTKDKLAIYGTYMKSRVSYFCYRECCTLCGAAVSFGHVEHFNFVGKKFAEDEFQLGKKRG